MTLRCPSAGRFPVALASAVVVLRRGRGASLPSPERLGEDRKPSRGSFRGDRRIVASALARISRLIRASSPSGGARHRPGGRQIKCRRAFRSIRRDPDAGRRGASRRPGCHRVRILGNPHLAERSRHREVSAMSDLRPASRRSPFESVMFAPWQPVQLGICCRASSIALPRARPSPPMKSIRLARRRSRRRRKACA